MNFKVSKTCLSKEEHSNHLLIAINGQALNFQDALIRVKALISNEQIQDFTMRRHHPYYFHRTKIKRNSSVNDPCNPHSSYLSTNLSTLSWQDFQNFFISMKVELITASVNSLTYRNIFIFRFFISDQFLIQKVAWVAEKQ